MNFKRGLDPKDAMSIGDVELRERKRKILLMEMHSLLMERLISIIAMEHNDDFKTVVENMADCNDLPNNFTDEEWYWLMTEYDKLTCPIYEKTDEMLKVVRAEIDKCEKELLKR
jgi:hypothetical protein